MTKTTEENLSQSKYAEHRNVTKGYIGRLIKEGRLHLIKGKLNVEMSDAELDNKSNNDKAPNYWSEKALHEKAKRELAELDLKLKQDQLVEVDQVGLHLDLIFSAVRQRLLATPSKIAPLVHAEESVGSQAVPAWIKNNAGWWATDQIDDIAFVQGIQYLIQEGIIVV